MSVQSAQAETATATKGLAHAGANGADRGAREALLTGLKPKLLEAFEDDNVSTLPRPELALRIGQIVTNELSGELDNLNLLERRNLVGELITWLLSSSMPVPEAAPASPAKSGSAAPDPMEASKGVKGPVKQKSASNRTKESAAADSAAPHTGTVDSAKSRIQPLVMERLDLTAASQLPRRELAYQVGEIVTELLQEEQIRLNGPEHQAVVDLLLDDMLGLGPLEPLLADESITDILVNGSNQVYVEQAGKLHLTGVKFRDDSHVLNVARRIVSQIGRRVDETTPMVDARLKDGSRVNIIIPPLAIDGPTISIRKFAKKKITLDVMMRQNNVSDAMATLLKIAARSQLNILISGGTGSGKTTLLNAMSQMIDHGERIVTIEDAAELQLQQPHVVRLETRPANLEGQGDITMRDLMKNALRMRPDRIILGEVRGSEAVDMLQAMNTGHDGSLGTIHANRPREALVRLENMIGLAGINLPAKAVRTQIAAALDLVVQIARMRDGVRRVTAVTEVVGMEGDIITTQDLFTFEYEGEDDSGMIQGQFKSSGLRPHFAPQAAYFGLERKLMEVIG
jgi:pilus assembly protein CpaF